VSTDSAELLTHSRALLSISSPQTAGLWPRAAALLARQALEESLDEFWASHEPGLANCSTRAQLLCVASYLGESHAETCTAVWGSLSRACHHHSYELAPTAEELNGWIDQVGVIAAEIERLRR
jgi:hypothetical protein